MKRLGLVIAVGCAMACTGTGADVDDSSVAVDPVLAAAMARRTQPVLVLPERPVTSIGRCAVEIGPRPEETRELVHEAFVRRNAAWRVERSDFEYTAMVLRSALEPHDGSVTAPIIGVTDDQAVELAIGVVVTNYELFGFTRADLARVAIRPGVQRDDGTLVSRTVEISGDNPENGYEQLLVDGQPWIWRVALNRQGKVRAIYASSFELLPRTGLCSDPQLAEGDPRLTRNVVGYALSYADIAGQPIEVGPVAAADIQGKKLIVHRAWDAARRTMTLRLAYSIGVRRSGLDWAFIVDADTGDVIEVEQLFHT